MALGTPLFRRVPALAASLGAALVAAAGLLTLAALAITWLSVGLALVSGSVESARDKAEAPSSALATS